MTEHYIQPLPDDVSRKSVEFKNRFGITLSGDLYAAKKLDKNSKHPAIVVGPPYGGCKEQGSCVYAHELARRGFVVLAFDPPFMGASGGSPRYVSSPEMFAESFSAAVDFLGLQNFVDREKIGAIGICGSGGFALNAAAIDTRIKAVATASFFDVTFAARAGQTAEQIQATKIELSQKRWADAESGDAEWIPTYAIEAVEKIPDGLSGIWAEFHEFYGTKRGHHPNARGSFTTTSNLSFLNFDLLAHADEISPRPVLMIVGENAESNFMTDAVFPKLKEPKEKIVIPAANHIDLYDGGKNHDKIPFDKLEEFFKTSLAK